MSPQSVLQKELNQIRDILEKYPKGLFILDLENEISDLSLERRTLQRRLNLLIRHQMVQKEGHGVATRYFALNVPIDTEDSPIPLSQKAKELQRQVDRPVGLRNPVGYQRDFLEKYEPNVTFYLSDLERQKLSTLGKTTLEAQVSGTHARNILNRLLIDLSWNSSRLEGNTYSLLETQRLIEFGECAEGKNALDTQMILNHKEAIEFLVQSASEIDFNRQTILSLHGILSNNLLPDPFAGGRLRHMSVGIFQSVYEPLAAPHHISECFDMVLDKACHIQDPFEQSLFIMVHLPYLQPFDDVNKRVSRLSANIPFLKKNLSPLSFVDVPDKLYIQGILAIYELNQIDLIKDIFLWAYERSCARYSAIRQSLGLPDLLKLRYAKEIKSLIGGIIDHNIHYKDAIKKIADQASGLLEKDQKRFIELVETELLSLHEGNCIRYTFSFAQFKAWEAQWKKPKTTT